MESVVDAILSFLSKTIGFVAEHKWALTAFAVELIGVWLMQKVKRVRPLSVVVLSSLLFSCLGLTFLAPF